MHETPNIESYITVTDLNHHYGTKLLFLAPCSFKKESDNEYYADAISVRVPVMHSSGVTLTVGRELWYNKLLH